MAQAPKWHGRLGVIKLDTPTAALQQVPGSLNSVKAPRKTDRPKTPTFGDLGVRYGVKGLRGGTTFALGGPVIPTAAKIHGRLFRMLLGYSAGAFNIESSATKVKVSRKADWPKTTTFGFSGGVSSDETFDACGLGSGDISIDGDWDATAGGIHDVMRALLDNDPNVATLGSPLAVMAPMGYAIGNPIDMCQLQFGDYNIDTSPEKVIVITGTAPSDDIIDWGYSLHDLVQEVGVANFASVDETGATTVASPYNPALAHLLVTALGAGSATIKVQHSPDNATWTDLLVFGAVTGLSAALGGVQRLLVPAGTTIQRYTRCIISAMSAGNITFQVSFARRGFTAVTPGTLKHWLSLYGPFGYGTPTVLAPVNAGFNWELGPAGTNAGIGLPKYSGAGRLTKLDLNYDITKPQDFAADVMINGAVVEGTY